MSTREFQVDKDGFYGIYYPNPKGATAAVIAMLGDSCDDYLARKLPVYFK